MRFLAQMLEDVQADTSTKGWSFTYIEGELLLYADDKETAAQLYPIISALYTAWKPKD